MQNDLLPKREGETINNLNYEIIIPNSEHLLEQDEEYIIVDFGNRQEKVRFHDYDEIYKIPGLYEEIFYKHLKCNSPKVICDMLEDAGCKTEDCRVLDLGAGNGMVGEQIKERGGNLVVGVDIITEAREATARERAGIYDAYYVMDLCQLDDKKADKLKQYDFNTLITVGALGFNDIPPLAFLNAFNLIKDGGWIAFNIRDKFLTNRDDTGYRATLRGISDDDLFIYQRKRYCHRLSLRGEEIYYIAIVGKKIRNVNLSEL